jgi:glycosyltransferase involved in cell wall biosynthesis
MVSALITVVTPCYNEEGNVRELYLAVRRIFDSLPQYAYEHLFIDNASQDATAEILRTLAATDPKVKVILNARNFGQIRSPYHAILQAGGDAVIGIACDFQDPPELIPAFLEQWEQGLQGGARHQAECGGARLLLRGADGVLPLPGAHLGHANRAAGHRVRAVRSRGDRRASAYRRPLPVLPRAAGGDRLSSRRDPFRQPLRKRGVTSQNFYTLYDIAFLGIVSHSKVPLRIAAMLGFALSGLSLLVALCT